MEQVIAHIISGLVAGAICLGVGWWLRGRSAESSSGKKGGEEGMLRELLSSVHALSLRVAADVGEHHTTVQRVDTELQTHETQTISQVGDLVERLLTANRTVQDKLTDTEAKLDALSNRMEHCASEARTDVLTGLANRRAFQEEIARVHDNYRQAVANFSLIMIDIDRFKQVNDAHGHPFGDEVLHGLGEILLDNFRGRDIVTRYGGEEFAVLLPATEIADARRMAESVREIIERSRFEYSGKSLNLTVSMGVAEMASGEGTQDLLKRADQAMYAAKHSGRNRVYWHDGILAHPLRFPQKRGSDEAPNGGVLAGPAGSGNTLQGPAMRVVSDNPDLDQQLVNTEKLDHETIGSGDVDLELLSNLGTKTMFCQGVHRRIAEFKRGGAAFTALMLQVDQHEELARRYGDQAWKLIMGVVAQAIRSNLREMDLVSCYNDSTFGMVLPNAKLRSAILVGERLRKRIMATTLQLGGRSVKFTISVGVVEADGADEMAALVERARQRLEEAQQNGGNRTGFAVDALTA